jgi:hypothetical protein
MIHLAGVVYRFALASYVFKRFARRTLGQEDLETLVELLRIRPIQFCMFLAALFGEEQMETIISASVQHGTES